MHWQDFFALNSFSQGPYSLTPLLISSSKLKRTCLQPCLLDRPWTDVVALSLAAHGWTLQTHPLTLPGGTAFGSCGITSWLERAWPAVGSCLVPIHFPSRSSSCSLRILHHSSLWLFDWHRDYTLCIFSTAICVYCPKKKKTNPHLQFLSCFHKFTVFKI